MPVQNGWWNSIPRKNITQTGKTIEEVLAAHSVARQTFFYPFVTQKIIPASDSTTRKTFVIAFDADSDFECRELYMTRFPKFNFTLTFWDEFATSNVPVAIFAYETREIGGPNEPIDLVYPFPASSHAELTVEFNNKFVDNSFSAWLKGFKVFA